MYNSLLNYYWFSSKMRGGFSEIQDKQEAESRLVCDDTISVTNSANFYDFKQPCSLWIPSLQVSFVIDNVIIIIIDISLIAPDNI